MLLLSMEFSFVLGAKIDQSILLSTAEYVLLTLIVMMNCYPCQMRLHFHLTFSFISKFFFIE